MPHFSPPLDAPRPASLRTSRAVTEWLHAGKATLLLALLLGGLVRFYPALTHDFPLEDGGLFWCMTQAVRANKFALPVTVPYPTLGTSLPMCYPPLAFYLAAALNTLGFSLETIFRFFPALWATVSIYAFWRLARTLMSQREDGPILAGVATLLWALLPWSFLWMIMGGGLTRAPGLCWALLGAEAALRATRDNERAASWWAGIWLGLALLTHLERAHFLVLSYAIIWLVYGRTKKQWARLPVVLGLGLLLSAPWWGVCLERFGPAPFGASFSSGGTAWVSPHHWRRAWDTEVLFPILSLGGLAGAVLLVRKWPLLPLWLGAIVLLETRSPRNFATVPLALALALGLAILSPTHLRRALLTLAVLWALLQSSLTAAAPGALSPQVRAAMAWTRASTSPQARFLVFPSSSARDDWASDAVAEWFPALAGRASVLTVQGSEWLPEGAFARQMENYSVLAKASSWRAAQKILAVRDVHFDFVLVPRQRRMQNADPLLSQIEDGLRHDPAFARVFANSGATIWRRVPKL